MTDKFDPYYKWLGIPPRDQPPHHYRLLGIELFESDRDVIDAAANRVMAYLKDLAAGDEAEYSQSLLNEVSRARICLLNKDKKTAYDKDLRADLKSKGIPEPKAGKPAARPPAKRRKEAPEENATSPQPPAEAPWPKIRTDAPRSKAKADPVVFAEPDESDESDDERPAGTGRWKLVAAVAAVLGVVIAGLIVAAVFLFPGTNDDQVASAQNGGLHVGPDSPATDEEGPGQEGKPEDDPDSGAESDPEMDPEADPEADPETDPSPTPKAKTEPPSDVDGSDSPGSKTKPEGKPDDSPAPDGKSDLPDWSPGEQNPDDGSSTGKPSSDGTSDEGSAKPKDEPATDDTTDPKEAKPSSDDTMVAKVDVPDVDPAKEPVVPKPPKKPMPQPFQDLPLTVSLPDLEAADAMTPQVLGPVHYQPDDLCFIKLRGGKKASKGSQEFIMRNAEFGSADRDWEILSREGESDPATKIAHLSINDQSQLAFQWQPQAKTVPLTANLCNCAFSLNCNGKSHIVALRQAEKVEGMALELDKPSTDEHWKIELGPDPDAVKIEIVGVQGAEYAVQPTSVIEADRGEAWIDLKDGGELLSLQVETDMKRNVEVTVTPHLKTPPDGRPTKFNARLFKPWLNEMKTALANAPFVIQRWKQAAGQATGPQKAFAEQQVVVAEQRLVELQAMVDDGVKLEELLKNADENLRIRFRVFYDADSTEVDLLHIGG